MTEINESPFIKDEEYLLSHDFCDIPGLSEYQEATPDPVEIEPKDIGESAPEPVGEAEKLDIVREKFGKKKTPVKGVYKDDRDQFYSELYAYLTDTLKKAANEFVELKKDELHENVITPFSQSKKEIMDFITRENKEPEDKRLLRLSKENELLNDYSKAVKYYKARLLLDPNKEAWLAYCNLTKKLEDIPEVETSLINDSFCFFQTKPRSHIVSNGTHPGSEQCSLPHEPLLPLMSVLL